MAPSTSTTARPDLAAHEHVKRLGGPEVVSELRDLLGAKPVAYIPGVGELRTVQQWAAGKRDPRTPVPQRLRVALQALRMVAARDDAPVARAWLVGFNPLLDDLSPARLLREGDLNEAGPQVLAAARAFVADA